MKARSSAWHGEAGHSVVLLFIVAVSLVPGVTDSGKSSRPVSTEAPREPGSCCSLERF